MDRIPFPAKLAAVCMALTGIVALAGGIVGWTRDGSIPSLLGGGVSGVILIICAIAAFRFPVVALVAGMLVCLVLLGLFLPTMLSNLDTFGQFAETLRGAFVIVVSVGALLSVIAGVSALIVRPRSPAGASIEAGGRR
jgi:uncharacterized membrane protein (UPF0136 family)